MDINLPDLDGKKTQRVIEDAFEKYRFYKFVTFDEREAAITPSYELKEGTGGRTVSDQTATIATYNVDTPVMRREYCARIEKFASRLPSRERMLVQERYMKNLEYVTDTMVIAQHLMVSTRTYAKLRRDAFYKLAFMLHDFRMINFEDLVKD